MALTRILEAACCAGRGSGFRNRPGQLGGAWRAQRSCSFPVWKNFNFPIAGKANLAPTSGGPRGELTHGRTPFLPHAQDDLLFSSPHSGPKFPLFLQGLRAFCLSHTGKLPSEEEVGGRPPLLTDLPPTPPYLPPTHTHTPEPGLGLELEPLLKAGQDLEPLAVATPIPPLEADPTSLTCL